MGQAPHWTPETCPGIAFNVGHVYGSLLIEPGTLKVLGRACMYCHTPEAEEVGDGNPEAGQ